MKGEITMTDRKLATILISIGTLNTLDYFLTLNIIAKGASELNPLMNIIIDCVTFPITKLVILPIFLLFMWFTRRHWGRMKKITEKSLPFVLVLYAAVTAWHFLLQTAYAMVVVLA